MADTVETLIGVRENFTFGGRFATGNNGNNGWENYETHRHHVVTTAVANQPNAGMGMFPIPHVLAGMFVF